MSCRYQDLVDVGLNIAELVHLEGQSDVEEEEGQEASGSEVDGTELWQAARALREDEQGSSSGEQQQLQQAGQQQGQQSLGGDSTGSTGSNRSSGEGMVSANISSDSTTVLAHITAAENGSAAAAAANTAGMVQPGSASSFAAEQELGKVEQAALANGVGSPVKHTSSSKQHGSFRLKSNSSTAKQRLPASDVASAGSVKGASLQMASLGGSAPPSLSTVRLAAEANRNLTGVEAREEGNVSGTVFKAYMVAGGGVLIAVWVVAMMAMEQGARVFTDTWLGFWAGNLFHQGMWFYIGIYAASGILYSLLTYFRCAVEWVVACVCCQRNAPEVATMKHHMRLVANN